mmetsp:Transcript_48627/g.110755  ORF Transcript_48627/g.110755 Transcript_48627/m.110755 type:complete len:226 (+) Transcript_48627:101-778(+)
MVVLVCARLLHDLVDGLLLLRIGDGTSLHPENWLRHRDNLLQGVLRHILELGLRRVALLHALLPRLTREDEELRLVELQPVDIGLEALSALVPAAVVHSDADGGRKLHRDLGLLKLIKREALAQPELHVVALCRGVHHGAQEARGGPGGELRRLLLAIHHAALLAAGLVQPCLHHHPVEAAMLHAIDLAEVHIRDHTFASASHLAPKLTSNLSLVDRCPTLLEPK